MNPSASARQTEVSVGVGVGLPRTGGEEAGACAAEVGDDVVDDCVVGDEAHDTQFARACRTGEGFD